MGASARHIETRLGLPFTSGVTHRRFDGVDDYIKTSVDTNNLSSAWTVAALVRTNAQGVAMCFVCNTDASDTITSRVMLGVTSANLLELRVGSGSRAITGMTILPSDGWVLAVGTKAAGTVTPRGHLFKNGVWTHVNAGATLADATTQAGGSTYFGRLALSTNYFAGDLAVIGEWTSALTDAQIETLDDGFSSQKWGDLSATEIWEFNQSSVGSNVNGAIGNADQNAIVGTSVQQDGPTGVPGVPVALGSDTDPTSTGEINITTSAAVPAGGKLILLAAWRQSGSTPGTLSTITAGGLTWTKDYAFTNAGGGNAFAIEFWSATAPSGLAASTALKWDITGGTAPWGINGALMYATGLATSSYTDGAGSSSFFLTAETTWNTGKAITFNDRDMLVAASYADGTDTAVTAETGFGGFTELAEVHDATNFWSSGFFARTIGVSGTVYASGTTATAADFGGGAAIAAYESGMAWAYGVSVGDVTPPVVTILSGPTATRISSQTGQDQFQFTWECNENFQAYKIKSVTDAAALDTQGTLIEQNENPAAGGTTWH